MSKLTARLPLYVLPHSGALCLRKEKPRTFGPEKPLGSFLLLSLIGVGSRYLNCPSFEDSFLECCDCLCRDVVVVLLALISDGSKVEQNA